MPRDLSETQLAKRLQDVPLFAHTTARQRKILARLGKVVSWREGSVPIEQGSGVTDRFFLLLDGSVEVTRDGATLARLSDGDFVGEMALLSKQPRSATVTALSDTTTFALGRTTLAAALKTDPSMGVALLEAMADRQRAIQ